MWKFNKSGKDQQPIADSQKITENGHSVASDVHTSSPARPDGSAPRRVLIADDDADVLSMLQNALKFRGYEVLQAENGDQAWEMILREVPDAAILDIDMPYLSGLQVCRNLRAEPRTRHIGVIFLTGHQEVADKILGFEVGGDDYITKPFLPRELTARLSALMKRLDAGVPGPIEPDAEAAPGQVIGVIGAKGGVGTSSIAVNLAVSLGLQGHSVSLVDLALEHSIDTMLMDLTPSRRGTIVELSKGYARQADWPAIQSFMLAHQSGVWVLPGPINPAHAELVTGEHARHYIETMQTRHKYIVVDFPSNFRDTSLDVLDLCDALLVVVTPDLPALKCLKGVSEVVQHLLHGRTVQVLVNEPVPNAQLSEEDIKEATSLPVIGTIPHGGPQFAEAMNMGTPLVQRRPQHPVSQAIKRVAQSLTSVSADSKSALKVVRR